LAVAYGESDPRCRVQFEKLRHVLRHDRRGVDKVICALAHLRDRHPRRRKIATELVFFRKNRHRMRYAAWAAKKLPIGSGVTEAACKDPGDAAHEAFGDALAPRRRPSDPHLPRPRPERPLR